jgi:sulfonate transport system ATP-binding protein
MSAHIQLRRVGKRFEDGPYVLHDINLDIQPGEIISIIGPSGCGKSTLLRVVAGLDRDYEGSVQVGDRLVHQPGPEVGFMFQEPRLFPWLSVAENVGFGIPPERKEEKLEIIRGLLRQVQLPEAARQYPRQLSGGMMQRVAIARALAGSPGALLLDEPFSALDAFTRIHLQELILSVWEEQQLTMLLVTHDVDEALYLSNRVLVLSERPATLDEIISISLPRPRDRRDPELLELRGHLLEKLRLAGVRRAARVADPEYAI